MSGVTGYELGHVTEPQQVAHGFLGGRGFNWIGTALPARPAKGMQKYLVTCSRCGNMYKVRVDSPTLFLAGNIAMWVAFPALLVLSLVLAAAGASMLMTALIGAIWAALRFVRGKGGVGRPRLVKKVSRKETDHRIFRAQTTQQPTLR